MSSLNNGEEIIKTDYITKLYGKLKAVDEVSLTVKKAEIYGFLGLNGAGKTTTIRMLLGMIRPASGKAFICGQRIVPGGCGPWEKVGYMVELPYSYPELTVKENLMATSRLRRLAGSSYSEEIISLLRLNAYADVKARNLSQGNNQRLGLAKALIHKPEVLILDEPSTGLDPAGIVEIRELLKDFALKDGVTVFVSSHNLDEISRIATRIGIIHTGRLVQEIDTDILDSVLERNLFLDTRDRGGAVSLLKDKGYEVKISENGMICIPSQEACEKPEAINELLVRAGFPPHHLDVVQEDLESYFLRVIGSRA
jgi:ABC-2 type transport system ATP-binding protein